MELIKEYVIRYKLKGRNDVWFFVDEALWRMRGYDLCLTLSIFIKQLLSRLLDTK